MYPGTFLEGSAPVSHLASDLDPVQGLGPVTQPGPEGFGVFGVVGALLQVPDTSVEPLIQWVALVHGEVVAASAVVPAGMVFEDFSHDRQTTVSRVVWHVFNNPT